MTAAAPKDKWLTGIDDERLHELGVAPSVPSESSVTHDAPGH